MTYSSCRGWFGALTALCVIVLFMVSAAAHVPPNDHLPDNAFVNQVSISNAQSRKAAIDSLWGAGLSTAQKLTIFDNFWSKVDSSFVGFAGLQLNWDTVKSTLRPLIAAGMSRGRFAAVMSHLVYGLHDGHTSCSDKVVALTPLTRGVPLLKIGAYNTQQEIGAGLTPLPDSSLLVYEVETNHPLGLQRGDIILGYDGIPWKKLSRQLLDEQIPLAGAFGTSESSRLHSLLLGACNWHLFDTIDIVRFASGDTVHLPTSVMDGKSFSIFPTEQLDVPGVPKPASRYAEPLATSGIVTGTNIGYIYVWGWTGNVSTDFDTCVSSLLSRNVDGLIIDFRHNIGGNMFLSNQGLQQLFKDYTVTLGGFANRCSVSNRLALCAGNNTSGYAIQGNGKGFQRPIAVLTGPAAFSSGDQVALRLKFHPTARFFGKPTGAGFDSPRSIDVGDTTWYARLAVSDCYLASAPGEYLNRKDITIDEPVWLSAKSVANGKDDVVEAALAWIKQSTSPAESFSDASGVGIYNVRINPSPIQSIATCTYHLAQSGHVSLCVYNTLGERVDFVDAGNQTSGQHNLTWLADRCLSGSYMYRIMLNDLPVFQGMVNVLR